MKNKITRTLTAFAAALILMGGFSVPAFAQGAAAEQPAPDATDDSGVVVEESEEAKPLTRTGTQPLWTTLEGTSSL